MKLLAVVAIALIACLGTPDKGFAESWPTIRCMEIRKEASSYYGVVEMNQKAYRKFEKENLAYYRTHKTQSPDLKQRMHEENEVRKKAVVEAAHYAQIYSAFCK